MHSKAKNYSLVFCLFVFLFMIIGGGLHLNPGGAFLAAATGTPLVICAFNRRFNEASRSEEGRPNLRVTRLLMSAARQISPISEGAPARSDSDAGSAEGCLSQSKSAEPGSSPAIRRRLPDERRALTHHFSIAGQEGYLTVGVYDDGLPGEIFITMAKQNSTISGLMDSFATAVSLALQYECPARSTMQQVHACAL
jgi:hypothetical protein